jgi:hypothetical protein
MEYDLHAAWHRQFGTEDAAQAPFPALPPAQGNETHRQLEQQRMLSSGYVHGDPPNSYHGSMLKLLVLLVHRLNTDYAGMQHQFGVDWTCALNLRLRRSVLVRALHNAQLLREEHATVLRRTESLEGDRAHDAPPGWVYRKRADGSGVYVCTDTGATSATNPRDAKHAELEARIPSGDNYTLCTHCRQLLWGDRPGGKGRFIFVESVACSCNPEAFYCTHCTEELGWTSTRRKTTCPACSLTS